MRINRLFNILHTQLDRQTKYLELSSLRPNDLYFVPGWQTLDKNASKILQKQLRELTHNRTTSTTMPQQQPEA